MAKRRPNFRPRAPIPKDKLIKHLEDGLTMQEIGDMYNKARSTISETCALYGIDANAIEGREEKIQKRRQEKKKKSFVDVMYNKIRKEL